MYETKFSGTKDSYESGATRDKRAGKGRFDLISPHMIQRLAGVYERGAVNHGDKNWEKGVPFSRLLDSALRHINQFQRGLVDEDHLTQAIWNLAAIVHFQEMGRGDLNDLQLSDVSKNLRPNEPAFPAPTGDKGQSTATPTGDFRIDPTLTRIEDDPNT